MGSILGIWEAWNRDAAHFGREIQRLLHPDLEKVAISDVKGAPVKIESERVKKRWIWFTLEGKYWHELGFLAAFSQLCAASIFWISGYVCVSSRWCMHDTERGMTSGSPLYPKFKTQSKTTLDSSMAFSGRPRLLEGRVSSFPRACSFNLVPCVLIYIAGHSSCSRCKKSGTSPPRFPSAGTSDVSSTSTSCSLN